MRPGPRNLITDVETFLVGNAVDTELKSGVTVLTAERPFVAAVQVMGGAPGTRETDLLAPDRLVQRVDALVLSGGSAFGLDAGSGVADALAAAGRGFEVGPVRVPIVPAAILFDLLNGGDKDWEENPYRDLGRRALESAGREFALGTAGAGAGATTANLKGGLGSASLDLGGGVTVGALVAANPVGSVTVPGSREFWAATFELGAEFGGAGLPERVPAVEATFRGKHDALAPGANTTIAIVATNARLAQAQAQRMAVAAHDGIARAVVPSHTPFDGDLVFAVSSAAGPPPAGEASLLAIGHAASLCLARAIARGVFHATPVPGDRLPCWSAH
ncbi:MAG: P1 family peptidase [Immundisolibacterales bacterium]|nr:P1 family peptidase [Immundisolibacterales bacterium]